MGVVLTVTSLSGLCSWLRLWSQTWALRPHHRTHVSEPRLSLLQKEGCSPYSEAGWRDPWHAAPGRVCGRRQVLGHIPFFPWPLAFYCQPRDGEAQAVRREAQGLPDLGQVVGELTQSEGGPGEREG